MHAYKIEFFDISIGIYICIYMKYMNLFSKLSAHIGAFYVATGPGSYAAGAPAGSTASEPVMSLAISIKMID